MLNKKGLLLLPSYSWQWLLLLFSSATFAQVSIEGNSGSIAKEQTEITQHFNQLSQLIKENPDDGIALFHTQEEAYSNHPSTYAKARILVAGAYGESMDYEKAHLVIDGVLNSPIDSATYYNGLYQKGYFYNKEKRLLKALQVLEECEKYASKKDSTLRNKTQKLLVKNLIDLSYQYQHLNKDSFLLFLTQAETIVTRENYQRDTNKVAVFYMLGANFARTYDTINAFKYFDQVNQIAEGYHELMLQNTKFEKALVYGKLGQQELALEYHKASLVLAHKNKDNYGRFANPLSIGHLFYNLKQSKKAINYYQQSYDFAKKINNAYYSSVALTNLGNVQFEAKDFEKAIASSKKALQLADSLNNKYVVLMNHLNLANIKHEQGLIEAAINHNSTAYEMAKTLGFKEPLANSAALFAELAFLQKNYGEAIKKSEEVLTFKSIISKQELVKAYKSLAKNQEALGNYEKALQYQKLVKVEADSFYNSEKVKAFAELEAKFNNEKITIENQNLKSNQTQNKIIIQQRTWLAIAAAVGLMMLAIIAWVLAQRNKQKQFINQLLKKEVKSKNARLKQTHLQLENSNQNAKSLEKLVVEKDSKLATKVAELTKFNKQVEKIEGEISALMQEASDVDKKTLYQLKRKLQSIQLIDSNYLKEFNLSLKNYDPEFFQKLIKNHPNLTQNELNHCAFIRLNMTMKEVADLMNITEGSVKKARYRLKKKIGLTISVDLKKHLIGM